MQKIKSGHFVRTSTITWSPQKPTGIEGLLRKLQKTQRDNNSYKSVWMNIKIKITKQMLEKKTS